MNDGPTDDKTVPEPQDTGAAEAATTVQPGAGEPATTVQPGVGTEATTVAPDVAPAWTTAPPPPPPPGYGAAGAAGAVGAGAAVGATMPTGAGYAAAPVPYQPRPQTSNKSVVAMVLAILSFVFCPVILAVAALIVAGQAKSEITASNGWLTGEGLVTGAKILSWINIALSALVMLFVLLLIFVIGISLEDVNIDTVDPTGLGV